MDVWNEVRPITLFIDGHRPVQFDFIKLSAYTLYRFKSFGMKVFFRKLLFFEGAYDQISLSKFK